MITAGAAELSRYQLYRRHRLNAGEVTCVNSVKTLSATGDYVNAENRGGHAEPADHTNPRDL
jgi:hypothetical protein